MNFKEYIKELSEAIDQNEGIEVVPKAGMIFETDAEQDSYESLINIVSSYNTSTSELIMLKESLNSTKKLESLGTMAAGMAHEFNNVLQPIAGFSDIMMQTEGLPDSHYEWLNIILKSAYRGSSLVDQIMNYSRKDKDNSKESVLVSELMVEFFEMISVSKDLHMELELDNFTPASTRIFVNKSEIHQVLINLYNNAVHAVEDKNPGIIKIMCSTVDQQTDAEIQDKYIAIEVVDNGYGIPKELLKKIFQPFYTTKKIGEGTGLGLSIIESIVKGNGGKILVESKSGVSTTFKLLLAMENE